MRGIADQLKALESRVRKLEGVKTEEEWTVLTETEHRSLMKIGWQPPEDAHLVILKDDWTTGTAPGPWDHIEVKA